MEPVRDSAGRRFAANLRAGREERGLSQSALAAQMAALGWPFHQNTVARIESGERPVKLDEALDLARILGMSVEELSRVKGTAAAGLEIRHAAREVHEARAAVTRESERLRVWTGALERAVRRAEEAGLGEALDRDLAVARRVLRGET